MSFFDVDSGRPPGDAIATNDVENVSEMFSQGLVALVTDVIKMLGYARSCSSCCRPSSRSGLLPSSPFLAIAAVDLQTQGARGVSLRPREDRANQYPHPGNRDGHEDRSTLQPRRAESWPSSTSMNAEHRDAWHQSIKYDSLALLRPSKWRRASRWPIIIGIGTRNLAEAGNHLHLHRLHATFLHAACAISRRSTP